MHFLIQLLTLLYFIEPLLLLNCTYNRLRNKVPFYVYNLLICVSERLFSFSGFFKLISV